MLLFSDQTSRTGFSHVPAGKGILVDRVGPGPWPATATTYAPPALGQPVRRALLDRAACRGRALRDLKAPRVQSVCASWARSHTATRQAPRNPSFISAASHGPRPRKDRPVIVLSAALRKVRDGWDSSQPEGLQPKKKARLPINAYIPRLGRTGKHNAGQVLRHRGGDLGAQVHGMVISPRLVQHAEGRRGRSIVEESQSDGAGSRLRPTPGPQLRTRPPAELHAIGSRHQLRAAAAWTPDRPRRHPRAVSPQKAWRGRGSLLSQPTACLMDQRTSQSTLIDFPGIDPFG